jgi:hypothetical protein
LTNLQLVGFKAGSSSGELLRGVSKLQELQQLELAGSLLQARQLLPLMACTALTRLCLASSNLGSVDAAALAAGAAEGADEDGSSSGAVVLSQLLPALQQLQELDVSGCRVRLQPIYCLTRLTSLHAGAHRFRFHPNLVTSADLFGISRLRRELRALDLSCNQLDHSSLQHLSQLVLLTSLNLAENSLGCENETASAAAADGTAGTAVTESAAGDAAAAVAAQTCCCLVPSSGPADRGTAATAEQAAAGKEQSVAQDTQQQQQQGLAHGGSPPSGLQHLARMQQLQELDLSSCGLQDITPLLHLAGELAAMLGGQLDACMLGMLGMLGMCTGSGRTGFAGGSWRASLLAGVCCPTPAHMKPLYATS